MAFIGGSFRKTVHSVMEALGAGLKTFVGPKHKNNREAIEFQSVRAAVTVVHDAEEFRRAVEKLSPALMVLDLGLTGLDGLEVIRRVRQRNDKIAFNVAGATPQACPN